jgi:Flp pilus assembly protein TadD
MMNLSLFTRLSILLIMGIVAPSHAALAPPTASHALNYDSLYSLLLGEFALQRNQTDIALREYSQQATATQDEQIIERAMQIANFLQDSKSALTLAQQWTTRNPKQAKAFYQLAYHALKERDFQQAMTAIDKLLVLEPETELEALFLSSYPTQVEQRKQLVTALTQLEKNYPKNAHLLFAHGLLVGENGDYRQALQFIEKAQQLNPHSVPTVLLYARLLSLNKQTTQALKVLEKALIHNPNSPQINMHYVRALISNKNYETAEKKLAQLLRNNPQNSEMLLMHALLSYDNQHDQQAINSFNKLLALQSNTGEAYYYLAMIAKRQNKPAEAENFLAQINEGERFLSAQVELAQLRIKDQRPKQVQQQFSEARQQNPDIANTLYALEVEILRDNGQLEEAYALLTDAIGKHPQDNLLLFSRALLAERRDNLAQFELDMLELLKRDPKNASYLNAYGYTLANRTLRLSEAEPLLREAIKLKPNDPAIMDSIGWLLYKQGHLFEALTYIKKAFAASADEEIGLHLAEILWICGYKAEAVKIWQQLLSQKPNSEAVLKHRAQWEK